MCRFVLFGGDSCINHEPGSGQGSFKWHKQGSTGVDGSSSSSNIQCTSLFIEPVSWMLPLLEGTIDGKVYIVSQLSHNVGPSVNQSVSQSLSQSVSQSFSQSVIHSVSQSVSQSASQPVCQSVTQSLS